MPTESLSKKADCDQSIIAMTSNDVVRGTQIALIHCRKQKWCETMTREVVASLNHGTALKMGQQRMTFGLQSNPDYEYIGQFPNIGTSSRTSSGCMSKGLGTMDVRIRNDVTDTTASERATLKADEKVDESEERVETSTPRCSRIARGYRRHASRRATLLSACMILATAISSGSYGPDRSARRKLTTQPAHRRRVVFAAAQFAARQMLSRFAIEWREQSYRKRGGLSGERIRQHSFNLHPTLPPQRRVFGACCGTTATVRENCDNLH